MSSTAPDNHTHCIALVDCNSFFVACEQVFNPKLRNRPVVVLSNNDGCVVARSKEAKALGIPMGAPAFTCKPLFQRHNIVVLSSNFSLYGDMSRRVMATLKAHCLEMEIYSVDEAFALLPYENAVLSAQKLRETVLQWTGILVSIGLGSTKTLAKVAGDAAKKTPSGILSLLEKEQRDQLLDPLPVGEIWGIGRKLDAELSRNGIFTAGDLCQREDHWIKKHFSVALLRTVYELRGLSCFSLHDVPSQAKSITCSRSFGQALYAQEALAEALSAFVSKAAKQLRNESLLTSFLHVFLATSRHIEKPYLETAFLTLPEPTNYTPLLIARAKQGLQEIFHPGLAFKKIGVTLGGLVPENAFQQDLFCKCNDIKKQAAMEVMDLINQTEGKIHFASEGTKRLWEARSDRCSSQVTTSWQELLTVRI